MSMFYFMHLLIRYMQSNSGLNLSCTRPYFKLYEFTDQTNNWIQENKFKCVIRLISTSIYGQIELALHTKTIK